MPNVYFTNQPVFDDDVELEPDRPTMPEAVIYSVNKGVKTWVRLYVWMIAFLFLMPLLAFTATIVFFVFFGSYMHDAWQPHR
jgi:hypothetical protein